MPKPENPPDIPWQNDIDPVMFAQFESVFAFARDHGLLPPEGQYTTEVDADEVENKYIVEKASETGDHLSVVSLSVPHDARNEPSLKIQVAGYCLGGVHNAVFPPGISEETIEITLQFHPDDVSTPATTEIHMMQIYGRNIERSITWTGWKNGKDEIVRLEHETGFMNQLTYTAFPFPAHTLYEGKQAGLSQATLQTSELNDNLRAIPFDQFTSETILSFAATLSSGDVHAWIEGDGSSFTNVLRTYFLPPDPASLM